MGPHRRAMGGTEALHRAGRAGAAALRDRVKDSCATPAPGPHPRFPSRRRPSLAGDRTGPRRFRPLADVQLRRPLRRLGHRGGGPGAAGVGGPPRDRRRASGPETRQPPAQVLRRSAPAPAGGRLRHRHLADGVHDRDRRRHRYTRLPRPGVPRRHPTLPGDGSLCRRRARGGVAVGATARALQQRVAGHAVIVDPHRAPAGRGAGSAGGGAHEDGGPRSHAPVHRLHASEGGVAPRCPAEFPDGPLRADARPARVRATGLDRRRPGSPHRPPTRAPGHTPDRRRPDRAGPRSPRRTTGNPSERHARPKWLSH